MNHKLQICLLAAAGAAMTANAWTVYDLTGPEGSRHAVDQLYWSHADNMTRNDYNLPNALGSSNHVRFELVKDEFTDIVDEQKIKLCGFQGWASPTALSAEKDFIFTLADENNNPTTDGTRLILANDGSRPGIQYGIAESLSTDKTYFITAGYRNTNQDVLDIVGQYTFYFKNYYSDGTPAYWEGEISQTYDGEFVVEFSEPAAFLNARSWNGYSYGYQPGGGGRPYNSNQCYIIDHYRIETFTPNATFTCRMAPYNFVSGTNGSFGSFGDPVEIPVKFTMNADGTFTVLNMFDTGYAIYPDNECRFAPGLVTGYYDATTGTAYLDGGQYGWKDAGVKWNNDGRNAVMPGKLTTIDPSTRKFDATYSDIVISTSGDTEAEVTTKVEHVVKHNHWVSDGGTLRTLLSSGTLNIPTFAYVNYFILDGTPAKFTCSPAYGDGSLVPPSTDVTHELNHSLEKFGIDEIRMYVKTTMTPLRNQQYVESYDFYMVPGEYKNGDVLDAAFDHEHGHRLAQPLLHVAADKLNGAVSRAGASHTFETVVPVGEIANTDADGKYSFFVRANYKPESGLAPTFHGLVTVENDDQVTGIDSAAADNDAAAVTTGNGCIILNGVKAEIYNPAGAMVATGNDETVNVPAGIYIVRTATKAVKVIVR